MKQFRNSILALTVALTLLFAAAPSFGQQYLTSPASAPALYNASDYNYPPQAVYSGSTGTGAYTISLYAPGIVLANHKIVAIFGNTAVATENVALPPFTIGNPGSSNQETVTSYTVSGCNNIGTGASQYGNCQISATFTYAHGRGDFITSADNGFQEAMNDAANNGGGPVAWSIDCGIITLSTSGATTTTTCLVPTDFYNVGGSVHVTTTVATSTSYSIGISGHTAAFVSACTSLTAGLGCAGFQVTPTVVNAGAGTGDLLVTAAGGTASAGAMRIRVWGVTQAQSNY
jgi:hypothetical protein